METLIQNISDNFLLEAKSSPQLLEDMAAMEKYMAESYGERIFIELLQNADDAYSKRLLVFQNGEHIYVANDGRPFNEKDIQSISRSGSSSKERGKTIGYRGVGFKSTSYLTDEIIIHSNNVGFTFSKNICAKKLGIRDNTKVPTIRIPLLIEHLDNQIREQIDILYTRGYSTIFVFKNANMNLLIEELMNVNDGYYLFLNNIERVEFNLFDVKRKFLISREESMIEILEESYISKKWLVLKNSTDNNVRIAFKVSTDGELIPCEKEESVFHCYLPTLEYTGYPFKINSDFSTDPSRKHLTWDSITEEGLNKAADKIFNILKQMQETENNLLLPILTMLKTKTSFSKFTNYLSKHLSFLIENEKWIHLINGRLTDGKNYKKRPTFLETSEFLWLCRNSPLKDEISLMTINSGEAFTNFIDAYATNKFNLDNWIKLLSDAEFIKKIDQRLLGKLYAEVLKLVRSKSIINNDTISLESCFVLDTSDQIVKWSKLDKVELSEGFINELKNKLTNNDLKWIDNNYRTNFYIEQSIDNRLNKLFDNTINSNKTKKQSFKTKKTISKWRAAEYQCIEFETLQGNIAKDVSKQNVGYDVESKARDGKVRYIEVKSVSNKNTEISLTNNEYTAAHQYGDDYYLCIIYQDREHLVLEYIQNPLEKLHLEKRIRQWEWICDEYNGERFEVPYE